MSEVLRLHVLVVRARERMCALPLAEVEEAMRPLPVETMLGAPAGVLGVARIRGVPVPVVDLGHLLGEPLRGAMVRFVTVKQGRKRLALAVEELVGTRWLPKDSLHPPAASARGGVADAVESLGALEDKLLFLIRPVHLLQSALWAELPSAEAAAP